MFTFLVPAHPCSPGQNQEGCKTVVVVSLSLQSSAVEQVLDIVNGYPVFVNSRGGFPLSSSRFVITYCDQSFPSACSSSTSNIIQVCDD